MRRLALLFAGATLWLLLAAVPVFADGGPHVMTTNNGSSGLTADSCAGCHRVHTSQSPTGYLLTSSEPTVTDFCLSCHGSSGAGATTDVESGVQYALATSGTDVRDSGVQIGALRGGGFVDARIGSDDAFRVLTWSDPRGTGYASTVTNPRIPVLDDGMPVTSAHMDLDGAGGATSAGTVWGNGAISATDNPGGTVSGMECTSCHNPHGNGNYRILNAIPQPDTEDTDTFTPSGTAVAVTDDATNSGVGDETRNYTVIQIVPGKATANGAADSPTRLLTAAQVSDLVDVSGNYGPLSGDYLHKAGQYNTSGSGTYDAPNGLPATFYSEMASWCAACHTRYPSDHARDIDTGDAIFAYQHTSEANSRYCLTCHVSHGSNAVMNTDPGAGTTYSANTPFPDGTIRSGDSRLLKVDGRGICLLCHDPTEGSALPDQPPVPGSTTSQGTPPAYFP